MPRHSSRLGVGAKVCAPLKSLHPSSHFRTVFPNEPKSFKLTQLEVVGEGTANIRGTPTKVAHMVHCDAVHEGVQIYAAKGAVTLKLPGPDHLRFSRAVSGNSASSTSVSGSASDGATDVAAAGQTESAS